VSGNATGRILRRPAMVAALGVAALSASTWQEGRTYIDEVSSTLPGILALVSGDSEHYLAIADTFREGDYSMSHVATTEGADRAHRQPGYAALIALAESFGIRGAPRLALVNVALIVASMWIAFAGVAVATGSAVGGLVAAAVIYDADFLFDIATGRLLTEPLFVATALGACGATLTYLRTPGALSLLLAAALAGFAYLVRVNGLLLAAALAVAIAASDFLRARPVERDDDAGGSDPRLPLAAYALAAALFVVVTLPSWLPRVIYTGNPVYHGYLPNYLWVDEYERAHTPGAPRFSFSTYADEHVAGDAAKRMAWGLRRVFWDTPRDKFGAVASIAAAAAIVVLLAARDTAGMLFVCAAILQALPLAWTAMPNPARRLPAAALLPFVALAIGTAVAALTGLAPISPNRRRGLAPISPDRPRGLAPISPDRPRGLAPISPDRPDEPEQR
jgi:hypothetical protein